MRQLLETIDQERLRVNSLLTKKSELGQFLTPSSIAKFMASLFEKDKIKNPRLLDAGAGIGSLTSAFLERLVNENISDNVSVNAIEIDNLLSARLLSTLSLFENKLKLNVQVITEDFIEWAVNIILNKNSLFENNTYRFTHAILNPPYKKINSFSRHRKLLRQVGIETVNLYSAFVALTIELMETHGQIVFIVPRSFCNGLYFRPFRELLLSKTSIKRIHLFKSRDKAFKDDDVLQENVIMLLERGGQQGNVIISSSTDDTFTDYEECEYSFNKVVHPMDTEKFIRIPTSGEETLIDKYPSVCFSLEEIGIEVSTGPVVDFRVKEHLKQMPEKGTAPLLYPSHFSGTFVEWPKPMKKPNAIVCNKETKKWLYPNGYYTVVKRFTSKEEKRRVVAGVFSPNQTNCSVIGFENHLNVFHYKKKGISAEIAFGLYAYLNSTEVDKFFRIFNGHTQVNATDLRTMKYPSRDKIEKIGRWVQSNIDDINQDKIDQILGEFL